VSCRSTRFTNRPPVKGKLFLLFLVIGTLSACGGPKTPDQYSQAIENAATPSERLTALAASMDFSKLIVKNHDQMSAQDFTNWRKQHEITDRDLSDVLTMDAVSDAIGRILN
jgi:hypothetical protein